MRKGGERKEGGDGKGEGGRNVGTFAS